MADNKVQKRSALDRRAADNIGGLAKGLGIIELFATQQRNLNITAAAEAVGISTASARRCLLTLSNLGYLVQDGSTFQPAPRLLRLGAAYYQSVPLPRLAQPHLERAREELNESVSLAVLDGFEPIFVARAEAEKIVSMSARLGRPLPAYSSATGRVLIANLSADEIRSYLDSVSLAPLTQYTVSDKRELEKQLNRVRNANVAIVDQELELGLVSMAVPIVDHNNHVVAAMSVSGSRTNLTPRNMKSDLLPILQEHAAALSRAL